MIRNLVTCLIVALSLSACTDLNKIKLTPPYEQGKYHVAKINISGLFPKMEEDPEYREISDPLAAALQRKFSNYGSGPDIAIDVKVYDVSLDINALTSLLSEDSFRILTKVELRNIRTHELLGETDVTAKIQPSRGLVGIAVNAVAGDREASKKELIRLYANELRQRLYYQPKK